MRKTGNDNGLREGNYGNVSEWLKSGAAWLSNCDCGILKKRESAPHSQGNSTEITPKR